MRIPPGATLHGLFSLKEGVAEREFIPALDAYYGHLRAKGYVIGHTLSRNILFDGTFGLPLPDFDYCTEIHFRTLILEGECYEYVKGRSEPVDSLHRAMNCQVRDSYFFRTTPCIGVPRPASLKRSHTAPGNLTDPEWQCIFDALHGTRYGEIADRLRALANTPTSAHQVLTNGLARDDTDPINRTLAKFGVPFRLTTIGTPTAANRFGKQIAFVRWST